MLVILTSKICVILVLSNVISLIKAESGYDTLDPWGEVPVHNVKPIDDIFDNNLPSKPCMPEKSISYDDALNYYKRLINIIFKRNAFKREQNNEQGFVRSIHLRVSEDQFKKLLGPVETSEDLRKIDGVISEIFLDSSGGLAEKLYDIFEDWYHSFWTFIQQPFAKAILLVSVFLITLIYMKFVSGHSTIKISMMLLIIAAYCWTYYDMYMEAEINRIIELKNYPSPPKSCSIESMSYFEKIVYKMTRSLTSDACKDYYMLTSTTTFETINPAIVAVEMGTRLVTQPLSTAGGKLGQGLTTLYNSIPWPLSIIVFPIALVFFLIILIFFASYALGIHVNFNIFHLVSFSIGSAPKSEPPPPIKLEDIATMASAIREAQMHQITNTKIESLEQRLLSQCENILKYRDYKPEQKMIENEISEKSKDVSPSMKTLKSKDITNSDVKSNDTKELNPNKENISPPKNIDKSQNKIRTKKIVDSLMENLNEMENRLEMANRSIDEKLSEIKNAVDSCNCSK